MRSSHMNKSWTSFFLLSARSGSSGWWKYACKTPQESEKTSSSSDNESDSSDDELPTEEYTSDAYENSDDDMPSSVKLKYAKKGRTSKKGKSSPKRTLTNKSKKKSPLRL